MPNNREFVERIAPTWGHGHYGERWLGLNYGLCADLLAEGASQALRAPWLILEDHPDDALPLNGSESNMPRYPTETAANHRARLRTRWPTWIAAGSVQVLEAQFAAAGYPGAQVYFDFSRPGPHGEPPPYWSQFWMRFPVGTHPVTADGPSWDSFNWDDGTLWGPLGLTLEFVTTIRGIVRKWKPGHWICRGFQFEFGGAVWDGFDWDDGTVWGGWRELEF